MDLEHRLLLEALPNYDVSNEIGRGGWGVVLEASHKTLNRQVAVKQLPRAFGADPDVRARFLAEARMVASLDHPHIVPLYDFVERDGMCLLVMEYLSGGTLWDRFQTGGLNTHDSLAVSLAVLSALAHAHSQDILHRDVKPENVLFNAVGVPKLADFGIAKVLGDASSTRTATGVILGTPAYMAPEQGLGQEVTVATDIYAVGVMLYELLSGALPFPSTGEPLAQLFRHVNEEPVPLTQAAPTLPIEIANVIMMALEKEPHERPKSALEFAQALHGAGTACFGNDWLAEASFAVLDSRVLGRGTSPPTSLPTESPAPLDPAMPPETTTPAEPSSPTVLVSNGQGSLTPPVAATAPLGPSPDPVPVPPSKSPVLYLAIGIGLVAVAVVVVLMSITRTNGNETPETNQVPGAAVGRLEGACLQGGVAKEVCACAVDLAQRELSVAAFMANDELIQRDGDSLTAPMEQIFARCLEEIELRNAESS